MKLKELELTNWMPFAKEVINFTGMDGAVLLLGRLLDGVDGESNGAGKSSVLDAVVWSLYGESRAPNDDGLIRLGEKEMIVGMSFEIDEKVYQIVRSKKFKKSQKLQFTNLTDDVKLTGNSVKETQAKIVEVLGMSHTIFTNTVFCGQHNVETFAGAKPTERKSILSGILALDEYSRLEEKARSLANSYGADASNLRMTVSRMEDELKSEVVNEDDITAGEKGIADNEKSVSDARDRMVEARKQMESARSAAVEHERLSGEIQRVDNDELRNTHQTSGIGSRKEEELKNVSKERERLTETAGGGDRLRSTLGEIEAKISDVTNILAKVRNMREEVAVLRTKKDGLTRPMETLGAELDKLRAKIKQVHALGGECPLCMTELTEEKRLSVEKTIQDEGTDKRKEWDKLEAEVKGIVNQLQFLELGLKNAQAEAQGQAELEKDRKKYEGQVLEADMARTQLTHLDERIEEINKRYTTQEQELQTEAKSLKSRKDLLNKELTKINVQDARKAKEYEDEIQDLEQKTKDLTTANNDMIEKLGYLRKAKEAADKKKAQLETDKAKLDEVTANEFTYRELTRAFGRDGIPALIMDGALAEIQSEVSLRLDRLSRGRIQVEFVTTKELKNKKTVETLDIKVTDEVGTRDFALYSGGERVRVAIAIRLALSKIISRRAGKRIESIYIDEIADLDPAGLDSFVGMIHDIQGEYAQVFVVSHFAELKNRFPQVLTVVKDRHGSRIEGEVQGRSEKKEEAVAA